MTSLYLKPLAVLLFSSLFLTACGDQNIKESAPLNASETRIETPASSGKLELNASASLRENLLATPSLSRFAALASASYPSGQFPPEIKNMTLFVPLNSAFDGVDLSGLDRGQKYEIVYTHISRAILSAEKLKTDISASPDGKTYTQTGRGTSLGFEMDGDDIVVVNPEGSRAKILQSFKTLDGYIHTLDSVLMK